MDDNNIFKNKNTYNKLVRFSSSSYRKRKIPKIGNL